MLSRKKYVSINVLFYEDETPYHIYTWKEAFETHVDLLLLSNSINSHYVLINDLNRFMTNKTKHHGKKRFCWYSLQCFSSSKVLQCHVKNCIALNHMKKLYST